MDDVFTLLLARAVQANEGSTAALAHFLRVPEGTLRRWMSGRARMPLRAFLAIAEVLKRLDTTMPPLAPGNGQALTFSAGELRARCAGCGDEEFLATQEAMLFTSELACRACGRRVVHVELVIGLARQAEEHSAALKSLRTRQAALQPSA